MNILLIAKRDFAAILHGFWGYAILAGLLLVDGLLFNVFVMDGGAKYSHEVLEEFFYFTSGTTMVAPLLLSMRSFAEEKQQGTDVLLDTAPVSETEIVLGKFLAVFGVMAVATLLTLYLPAMIFVNGKVAFSHIGVGYVGILCLTAAATSIGLFGSSLVRNQVIAVILSGVILVAMLVCWLLSQLTDPPFTSIIANMTLHDKHFLPFQEGTLSSANVVYYTSVTYAFLMLTTRSLRGRTWR